VHCFMCADTVNPAKCPKRSIRPCRYFIHEFGSRSTRQLQNGVLTLWLFGGSIAGRDKSGSDAEGAPGPTP
jgi:hypothetical protein